MNLNQLQQLSYIEWLGLAKALVLSKVSPKSLRAEGDRNLVAMDLFRACDEKQWKVEKVGNKNKISLSLNQTPLTAYIKRQTTDANVFSQVFRFGEYKTVIDKYNEIYGSPATKIIDAGANAGYASLYFAAFFNTAKIVSLEIERGNSERMKANFEANPQFNIIPLLKGLWINEDELQVNTDFRRGGEFAFSVLPTKNKSSLLGQKVHGTTVQSICKEFFYGEVADILKIDIEGAEKFLFEDETFALDMLSCCKCLALEIHDDVADRNYIMNIVKKSGMQFVDKGETTIAWR